MTETFRALVAENRDDGFVREVREVTTADLMDGELLVRVERSSVNYKDALASIEKGRVARISPLVPGIDIAGAVVESASDAFVAGDAVIVTGYDLGVAHHGGFAGFARVPAAWTLPLPAGLTAEQAMFVGTAGYTAALSIDALERHGLVADSGPVLVTGATGGVGSMAVGMLARAGYRVAASTGKPDAADWLAGLGATEVLGRDETGVESSRPLESERWAGAVDCVGGTTLAYVLRTLRYGASVAASGLTGGVGLATTVMPFILRGCNLLGIDSVQTPIERRRDIWQRIASDLRPPQVDSEAPDVVGLDGLPPVLDRILRGEVRSRVLVDPWA